MKVVLFMWPIFPEITDYKEIIEKSRLFVDEYWFENLNLRGKINLSWENNPGFFLKIC